MKNLTEEEIREEFSQEGKTCDVPAFKRLKCLKSYQIFRKMTVNGKPFYGFKAGKSYDLWCVGVKDNSEVLVFIPGADQPGGLVFDDSVFGDWRQAPDAFQASCGGKSFLLIANYRGERLLVPFENLYPDNVSAKVSRSVRYDHWRPEFVFDGEKWFFGVAFYLSDSGGIFSSKKRCWQAFFRVDTQSWLPQEYCSRSAGFLMVALSEHPVEMGNYRIQFLQEVLHFSFI